MATWLVVKSTLLLALPALIVPLAGRRVSAASRHMTWGAGLAAALLLPVASLIVPAWPVTIRVAARTPVVLSAPGASIDAATAPDSLAPQSATNQWQSATTSAAATERSRPFDWTSWVAPVYGLGLLAMMLHLAAQHWVVRRIAGRARAMDDPRWSWLLHDCARAMAVDQRVRLLRSPELGTPVAIGLLRPSIVLPAVADTWPDDRRRAVLLHELAHVSRRDCLTQTLACLARAIHWFNPLAWWAARQLRAERELACDDRVLAAGTAPREYAGHLLEIAYGLGDRQTPALAVGMARPGQLEGRMLAALDDARPRSRPTLRFRLASISLTAVLVGPMSGATPLFVEDPGARLADDEPVPASVDPKPLPKTLRAAPWKQQVDHLLGGFGATGAAAERGQGTWEVRPGHKLGTLHLRIAEDHSSTERDVPIAQVEGLTAGQLNGADGPVQFRIRRDAGTFTFTGVVKNGVGAGTFAFEADARFAQELASRGIGKPTADQQYRLARADVGYALLDALKAQGYSTPSLEDLATAGEHGVSADYVQEMGRLGYKLGTLEPLITLRDHGVTPEYVSGLAALGYKGLSADAVRTARDHGVTPDYVRALQEAGYTQVPMDTLVTVRDHGITPDYIRDLVTAGYRGTPLDTLVQVRDHGVTGDYIRGMQGLGFGLSLEQLVNARDHGVTVEYATAIKGFGYTNETIETLIQMRDHGVTESYVKSVKELGYDRLSPGELIRLRDHGLTPDRIKRANGAGAARLSVDELVDKADRGL